MTVVNPESAFLDLLVEGTKLFYKREFAAAASPFWLAFRMQPSNPVVLFNLARVMHEMDDPRMEDFYVAAATQGSTDAMYQLADIYLNLGDKASAMTYLRAFLNAYGEEDNFTQWARKKLDGLTKPKVKMNKKAMNKKAIHLVWDREKKIS